MMKIRIIATFTVAKAEVEWYCYVITYKERTLGLMAGRRVCSFDMVEFYVHSTSQCCSFTHEGEGGHKKNESTCH